VPLTFIHVPHDGSAEPKHVVYWHNFRTNGIVCKQIHIAVCQTVFAIIIVIGVTHRNDPSKDFPGTCFHV
jgi:hypothetical protein